jgi:hypothetical protein
VAVAMAAVMAAVMVAVMVVAARASAPLHIWVGCCLRVAHNLRPRERPRRTGQRGRWSREAEIRAYPRDRMSSQAIKRTRLLYVTVPVLELICRVEVFL